ncbi:hypothetical protein E1H12_10855, partial [Geitlerinema sp. P-1104]|uniref:glycosyl hydrolase-related protein n=1 Tax=Geitlerinema sp. P-1104 TaxID=2546230 RepID=UPI0016A7BA93
PGDWKQGQTVQRAYELNQPLLVYTHVTPLGGDRPNESSEQWLSLKPQNLILMALKQSERNKNHWIIRVYDSQGETSQLDLGGILNPMTPHRVNLLEDDWQGDETIASWQIASFRLTPNNSRVSHGFSESPPD